MILGLDSDFHGEIRIDMQVEALLKDTREKIIVEDEFFSSAHLDSRERRSPGEDQRLKLQQILKNPKNFVLLDEPTSHLDIYQMESLIKKLKNRQGGFLMISHDREIINQTCQKIIEMEQGTVEVYNGNYEFYLEEKSRRDLFKKREYEHYISEKKRLESIKTQIKEKSGKIRGTPKRMGISEARLHKMGGQGAKKKLDKQVKAVESRIEQLEVKEKPKEKSQIELTAPIGERIHSKVLIRAEHLNKSFGDKILFDDVEFIIENNKKIAMLGENGVGKTTLLRMILHNENIWTHPNLAVGYYSQMEEILDNSKSLLENVLGTSIYDETMTRIILARLGFKGDKVHKDTTILSDGERAKLKLGKLLTSNFNILILDEPTNHLDIHGIEALEELLEGYDRTILFVTHDLALINHIAGELLIIQGQKIISFNGNYDDYKRNKVKQKEGSTQEDLLIDYRLASINSRLSQEISKEERQELEIEFNRLLEQKRRDR